MGPGTHQAEKQCLGGALRVSDGDVCFAQVLRERSDANRLSLLLCFLRHDGSRYRLWSLVDVGNWLCSKGLPASAERSKTFAFSAS